MAALAMGVIVSGPFPNEVKLGLLMGLFSTVRIVTVVLPDHGVSVRPELCASGVLITALITLRRARRHRGPAALVCLGAFLLTAASGLQNYMSLAFTGAAVYVVAMCLSLRRRPLFARLCAVVGAGCLFGLPYLWLYVIPNLDVIRTNINWGTTHTSPGV